MLSPSLDKHLKYCATAYKKHHQYRADGTDRAIIVQHNPSLVDKECQNIDKVHQNSEINELVGEDRNTRGAVYLASQLPHLHIANLYHNQRADPPQALFEGAALAWASPYNWFRSSSGTLTL